MRCQLDHLDLVQDGPGCYKGPCGETHTALYIYEGEEYAQKHKWQETCQEIQQSTPQNACNQQPANNHAGRLQALMACEKPIKAHRPTLGGPIRFTPPETYHGEKYEPIEIPCGTCILCREEQARQWAIRITHEATLHKENSFITLSYADHNLPENNSLAYTKDMQKFWKRLRHHHGALRYYAVGEYGNKTKRPHYHACVFGHAFTEGRKLLRRLPTLLWTSPQLEEAWGLGFVSVGALTIQTARYTASYVTKKLRSKQQYVRIDEETGELIALEQPKAYASKGIASDWLELFGDQVYTHDQVVIEGRPQKPPKYYDKWLKKRSEIALEMTKKIRIEKEKKRPKQDTHARAEIARARARRKPTKI